MANPDKFLRLRDYARLERAQKDGVVDGTKFAYDSAKHVVSNVREYFAAHRDGRTYGVRFPLYGFSNSPDGVKVGDNAGLTVVPSTNYRAGRDDYAGLSAFRVFDANVAVADDGTPVVKAIKGLAGNYAKDGSNGDVFVITTPGFYRFEFDTNHCTIWYSDTQYDGYSPMPGALLPDGSLRPCMAYAKYPLSNYGGKAASVSGQIPSSMSERDSVAVTTSKGEGYSGKTSADTFYTQLMHMLKYATKDIERHLGGDFNGSAQINVSKAETNVTRALVEATDAASIDLGSYVSVGTGTDRGDNKTGEAAAYRKVISKTVVDAATTAINVSGAAFSTTTAMHVTQMPYLTGSTDGDQTPGHRTVRRSLRDRGRHHPEEREGFGHFRPYRSVEGVRHHQGERHRHHRRLRACGRLSRRQRQDRQPVGVAGRLHRKARIPAAHRRRRDKHQRSDRRDGHQPDLRSGTA